MINLHIKRLYKDRISIRSPIIDKAIKCKERIKVTLEGTKKYMILEHTDLERPVFISSEHKSKFDENNTYRLFDYKWKPMFELFEQNPASGILPIEWYRTLGIEFLQDYMITCATAIAERRQSMLIYPDREDVFKAFQLTDLYDVKVVILGQDPYCDGTADGLAFSSKSNCNPTLANILLAMDLDLGIGNYLTLEEKEDYSLEYLAKQGVLLLNSILTVDKNKPLSHQKVGWKHFTKRVIEVLNEERSSIVYMLWGNTAKEYKQYIDTERNLVLEYTHPSSAIYNKETWRCTHFSEANKYLETNNKATIQW